MIAWMLIRIGETTVSFSWGLVILVAMLAPPSRSGTMKLIHKRERDDRK